MTDERKAEALFRQAWEGGVTVAAFELARLYEQGTSAVADPAQAWSWYEKGAAAAEPNALARLGAREDERAAAATVPAVRNAHWIRSFMYYASAAERARFEDWPAEFWRDWRYRRASLARLLARQGMMRQVAEEFGRVRRQYSPTANQ
jgi:hypothetical protein